jgi:hypothetical protein
MYMHLFPANLWLSMIYPSIMFAVWHLAPQSVVPNRLPGGSLSFVGYALLLGLTYAISVIYTGSIAWCTIAHIVHDTLGLGGFAYSAWLAPAGSPQRRRPRIHDLVSSPMVKVMMGELAHFIKKRLRLQPRELSCT